MDEDAVRSRLTELVVERHTNLKAASLAIGKNHAYLQQYLNREKPSPARLKEEDRQGLASFFGVDPRELGSRAWRPSYLDLLTLPLRCPSPQCGADFSIAVRGLISRDAIHCPQCGTLVDLKKLKSAIDNLARVAADLDKMTE